MLPRTFVIEVPPAHTGARRVPPGPTSRGHIPPGPNTRPPFIPPGPTTMHSAGRRIPPGPNVRGRIPPGPSNIPPGPATMHTGAAEASVVSLDAAIGAQIEATNTMVLACSALAPPDVTAWGGIYAAWQSLHQDWLTFKAQQDKISTIDIPGLIAARAVNDQYIAQMNAGVNGQSYLGWAKAYQTKVVAACPAIQPPPNAPPVPPAPPPAQPGASFLCQLFGIGCPGAQPAPTTTDTWPTAVKWIAIVAIVGVVVFYAGPAIAAAAGLAAVKIRERGAATPSKGANYSFGDVSIEAPTIEGLQFGDVDSGEVLALIGSANEP